MNKKEEPKQPIVAPLSPIESKVDEKASDVLILHYKSKMSVASLAEIFSMEETEVQDLITTFAEQFSNIDNLYRVVEGMAKMKKRVVNIAAAERVEKLSPKDKEIADLKRQLKESEIRAEAYLEMIKVAEQLYKIPIRKKYGAK